MLINILMYILWIVVIIIFIAIEIHTQQMIGWAASIAGIGAIIAHSLTRGNPIWIEILTFIVLWIILWLFFFIIFRSHKHTHDKDDGYLAYIGKTTIATEGNLKGHGEIRFNDKIFRFKSDDSIHKGDKIKIVKIKGITFIVKKRG